MHGQRLIFCETNGLFGPIAVPLKRECAKVKRMQASVVLCIKNRVFCVFLSSFPLSNCASCAITAAVSHRVSIRAHRVYVSVSGTRQAKKACVRFSPTGRSRPCVNSWFPCCLCTGDAISTCGECTISRANTIVTYKEPSSGGATQQMPPLSIALLTARNTVSINVGTCLRRMFLCPTETGLPSACHRHESE